MRTMPAVWASTALITFALNFAASASLCEAAKPARRPIAEPAALIRLVTALRPRARTSEEQPREPGCGPPVEGGGESGEPLARGGCHVRE